MFLHDPLQRAFLFAYMQRTYQIQWKPRIADTDNADSRIFRTTGQGRNFLLLKSAV